MINQKIKFKSAIEGAVKIFILWLFGILLLGIFRIILITIFQNKITILNPDFSQILITGFSFDSNIVMYFLLIPLLLNFYFFKDGREDILSKVRLYFMIFFTTIALFLSIITVTYFKEYDNQFNYYLFEGLHDDKIAIAKTILSSYHPFISLSIFVFLLIVCIYSIKKIEDIQLDFHFLNDVTIYTKIVMLAFIFSISVFAIRGALGINKPATRKWAYVSKDDFLNKTIINPIKSIIYAYKDYSSVSTQTDKNPYLSKDENINEVIQSLYKVKDIKALIKKDIKHKRELNPDHIVLTVMESYDSWALQEKYKNLHVSDNLRKIAKNGIHFKNFLPSSPNTMNSLGSIISGLPYTGVNISQMKAFGGAEITSIFEQFKKLGYKTLFFYGGLKSWQNIGNFVKNQGVDEVITSIDINDSSKTGIWGIDDDKLFDLVKKKLNGEKRTFSIIMTTSYHPPFTVDVYKKGYSYHSVSDYPKEYQKLDDGSLKPSTLGHLWYSDKVLGKFVQSFKKSNPNTLFAFTGDHFGRRYFNSKPNLYESSSVPFILQSDNLQDIDKNAIGSHIDILPTLFELVAPKGFQYYSFGIPMQQKDEKSISVGYKKILTTNSIFEIVSKNTIKKYSSNKVKIINLTDNKNLDKDSLYSLYMYKKIMAIYWHATINGIE